MARKIFFSFKYDDVSRAMVVRNCDVIRGDEPRGFIDKAEFEAVEKQGEAAIKRWIDTQLVGTTVSVFLLGANTNRSKWVRYELEQSIAKGSGILFIDISKIDAFGRGTTDCCGSLNSSYPLYRWNNGKGRENLSKWIEDAAKAAGK